MEFNKCQKDIIQYVVDHYRDSSKTLIPCVDVFKQVFKEKYQSQEIEDNTLELVSSGVLHPYSYHSYLELTETFKTSHEYILFKNKKL